MARPREFDLDNAVERAISVFWTKGYEAASLDDLCSSTGLARSSLYATFGDKQGLYLASLERYEHAAVARISLAVAHSATPLGGIATFTDRIIDDVVAGPGRRGCFIGNCAAELARQDGTVARRVRLSLKRLQATFRGVLAQAQAAGEVARDANLDALAAFIMASIQGLRLVGKANPDRALLKSIQGVMLHALKK